MNDQELANAASEFIGFTPRKSIVAHHSMWRYKWGLSAEQFVRDWRIAGQLMELAIQNKLMQVERWDDSLDWAVDFGGAASADHGSLPRAIIEACVKLLEGV